MPELGKYKTMLKVGMPEGAVRIEMEKDGVDPSLLLSAKEEKSGTPDPRASLPSPPPGGRSDLLAAIGGFQKSGLKDARERASTMPSRPPDARGSLMSAITKFKMDGSLKHVPSDEIEKAGSFTAAESNSMASALQRRLAAVRANVGGDDSSDEDDDDSDWD